MNYYERHLGDYAKDTGHLSLLEHGVYTLLLDRYYATESGIPEDQAHRLARARTPEERAAVDAVLSDFFILKDGVWINRRVAEELEKANNRINAARENGKKGGNPKKKAGYNEAGYLYAVQRQAGGAIKVGITKHPAPRMSDLRGKNGPINVLAMIEVADMGAAEAKVHRLFASVLDGEWISADASEVVAACHSCSQGLGTEPPKNFGASSQTHQSPDTTSTPDRSKQAPEISEGATLAGRACLLMRQAGCPTTNPSHPDLLAGLAEGVTPEAYADTVTEGLSRAPPVAKPFAWAITTARARHAEGPKQPPQNTGTHHGTRRLAPADEVEQFIRARQQGGNVIDATPAIAERHGSAVETHGSDLRSQVDQRLHGESGGRGGGDVVEGSFRVVGSAAR